MIVKTGAKKKGFTAVSFLKKGETEVVREKGEKSISISIGEKPQSRRTLITLLRRIVQVAKQHKLEKLFISADEIPAPKNVSSFELGALLGENFELANFEFRDFKTRPKEGWRDVKEILIGGADTGFKKGLLRGLLVGGAANKTRVLSNTPGGDMTPALLAQRAKEAARGTRVRVTAWGKKEIERKKMGAILGVARGSDEEPRFIILEYTGGKKSEQPIVLIGKGVTFDTGGLNLKPSSGISDMHMDMSGGAAVIHAVIAAAKLGIKKNIVGLIPAVENMPSGSSYRPGDILRSLSGKTIEVLNTDAEGRLILADALTYANEYKPRLVVDVATLTGASMAALGQRASALFTKDKKIEELFMRLGEASGDYLWPLPLWSEYEDDVKGNFADLANIPPSGGSYGGAINGAAFLYQFVKKSDTEDSYPWAHIDIAPRMTSIPADVLAKGATGAPVRFLVRLLEEF